ncbi:16S rRNA (guanine(966)-N(2))-methyltransferase RsmD [Facilibium subflavum]|uniref:16S rRNA (guanine(966)-N(2))-methyltransferase RsmD n=1 Tax=Facilibium subflavum TaxID=2219058 RepID=UPI000E6549DE|nr:16S rRNA (guanine(966)-N(2))-methyltransferase RsmD [Facilibium subflavum]
MTTKKPTAYNNQLRIIAGKLKGRKISFADNIDGLRPTADRIRETVFNWLMGYVINANCLDAFAGSGALGLEALSRGAKHCLFLEKSPKALHQIKAHCEAFNLTNTAIKQDDAISCLNRAKGYDIIFLDPPFASDLLESALIAISNNACISEKTLIYIEAPKKLDTEILTHFSIVKSKTAGDVFFALLQKNV